MLERLDEALVVVHRAQRVADGRLNVAAVLAHHAHGGFHVADVVHGVEDPEHLHPVLDGLGYESFHHVVRVVAVADDDLSSQEHLQARLGHALPHDPQPLPGVFVQEAHAGVEGGTAPDLQGPVADVVQHFHRRDHVFDPHPCGQERLVTVAQDGFADAKRFLRLSLGHGPTSMFATVLWVLA